MCLVAPSRSPRIQMIAATLTNSGTVTKKPAMKLRRSHCIENGNAERDAVPGEWRESGSPDDGQERFDDERRRKEGHHESDGNLGSARGAKVITHLEQIVRERGRHRRHRQEERELCGGRTIEPREHPPDDRGS